MRDATKPRCGCLLAPMLPGSPSFPEENCLYPESVAAHAVTEARLTEAVDVIRQLIYDAGWQGTKAILRAENFLEGLKNE